MSPEPVGGIAKNCKRIRRSSWSSRARNHYPRFAMSAIGEEEEDLAVVVMGFGRTVMSFGPVAVGVYILLSIVPSRRIVFS